MDEYYDDEISKSISFFEKIIQNYSTSKNTLLITLIPEFEQKYDAVVDSIIAKNKNEIL